MECCTQRAWNVGAFRAAHQRPNPPLLLAHKGSSGRSPMNAPTQWTHKPCKRLRKHLETKRPVSYYTPLLSFS
ncbi:hypothetical protein CDAR_472031 [Caerostris darwini]|uniref:Uncharacterized protein n=1 Tax=Caerostris darwini TaxID=1538125 RepID=A0AAV4VM62_9ARAC|nr:hypothetical protein CDAR_472031 [Caerostris darwini]